MFRRNARELPPSLVSQRMKIRNKHTAIWGPYRSTCKIESKIDAVMVAERLVVLATGTDRWPRAVSDKEKRIRKEIFKKLKDSVLAANPDLRTPLFAAKDSQELLWTAENELRLRLGLVSEREETQENEKNRMREAAALYETLVQLG